jgi:hypothetical protein
MLILATTKSITDNQLSSDIMEMDSTNDLWDSIVYDQCRFVNNGYIYTSVCVCDRLDGWELHVVYWCDLLPSVNAL